MARMLTVTERMQRIEALVFDVDGVLTDGLLDYGAAEEGKRFSVLDGFGFTLARQVGWRYAFVTARGGAAVERRAAELGAELLSRQRRKDEAVRALAMQWQLPLERIAYMGDDWLDLPAMAIVGLAASVPNAAAAVRQRAHWLSTVPGGQGAARELIEALLRVQGRLEGLLATYLDARGA
ncbi:MAG: HAD hydrolase family protein [Casimicrobiaceae bacterium]|nr:HAD hydrolase family protein [Casimicrobiaceae bacterium]MDW8311186.1 HAD hydrolase family protein [Burkholderiales bacterium]